MDLDDSGGSNSRVSRRRVLQSLGGAGTLAMAGCMTLGDSSTATATDDGAVTIALSTPESGRYSPIGDHERSGFELAIQHLNSGGGLVDVEEFSELSADGILGNTVESLIVDSEGDGSTTETNLRPHLENDELVMFTGGVAGPVVKTHRDLADEYSVPYFVGTSTLNELTGSNCSPYVFRELFNSTTLVRSLIPTVGHHLEGTQYFYHVHSDAAEGQDLVDAVNDYVGNSDLDWRSRGSTAVRSGTTDFESALSEAATNRVNIVFLDLFGLDAVNAIQQANDVLSDDTFIVVPLLTQSVADSLGERVDGIFGTVGWHESLDTPLSDTFGEAYQREYGGTVGTTSLVPPGPAQNAYGQVLLYAKAVEQADTFDPDAVRSSLEGIQYALGAGGEEMRACDHQAQRAVPVVRGEAQTDSVGNYFNLDHGKRNMEPSCEEEPAASCEM